MASTQIDGQFAKMTTNEDDTNGQTNQGHKELETSPQGNIQASPATGIETSFNDSGFCDCEVETSARRYDYEDWVLFPAQYPLVNTDNFFESDLESSTKVNIEGEIISTSEREAAYRSQNRRSTFYDPVHDAARGAIDQSVYEAMNDYNARSQLDYSRPYDAPIPNPFQRWYSSYEKHESLAYRLSQPSNPPRTLHSRQPPRPSDHDSRSR
jgi:hypothetical protein